MGGKIVSDKLIGKYVTLREVTVEDAGFILSLRCDENKSKFLHKTEYNLENQVAYIKRYFDLSDEWYFIIENKKGERELEHIVFMMFKATVFVLEAGFWLTE